VEVRGRFACAVASLLTAMVVAPAHAVVVQTFGPGSAVGTVDATADFEDRAALTDNPYVENGLSFTRTNLSFNNNGCGFAGCQGQAGIPTGTGNYMYGVGTGGYFSIAAPTGDVFSGLEFLMGTGFFSFPPNFVIWEAFLGGSPVGSGAVTLNAIEVIGFSDPNGFDLLRFSASFADDVNFTNSFNAPAFDQVRADLGTGTRIPEPGSIALIATGLFGLFFARGRLAKR